MYFEYIVSFFLAFIVSFSSTPIARKIAFRVGAVDIPNDERRMHNRPIARLGGLAIVAGFFVSFFLYASWTAIDIRTMGYDTKIPFMVLGLIIIAITGIIDDSKGMKAVFKLLLQVLAACVVVFGSGTIVKSITNPFSETGFYDFNIYVSYVVSILWIIGITNAFNLIDGLDGLATGVGAISCISLFSIAILNKDYFTAGIIAILAGTSLGFLPYNYNPAKIFMGDTGLMFLGFTLSIITIQGTLKSFAAISILMPVIALGLPLFDTTFAIFRRVIRGKPIMQADRGHLHHRLIDMGLTHKQAVLVLYTASATLGLSAIMMANKGFVAAFTMVVIVFVFVIIGARSLKGFSDDENSHPQDQDVMLPIRTFRETGNVKIAGGSSEEVLDIIEGELKDDFINEISIKKCD